MTALIAGGAFAGSRVAYEHVDVAGKPWTWIRVHVPPGFPLVMKLHRPWRDEETELTFKNTFAGVVAPLDIADRVFDRITCERLVTLGRELELDVDADWLTLRFRGWLEDPQRARDLIQLMTSMASRVPEAQALANAIAAAEGAPYRPDVKDLSEVRAREIDAAKHAINPKGFELPLVPTTVLSAPLWLLSVVVERARRLIRGRRRKR